MRAYLFPILLALSFSIRNLPAENQPAATTAKPPATQTAVFGMGCFWCSEALFERFRGVQVAVCGYAGGTQPDPTYEEVSGGATGHAEVVRVVFDPSIITYQQLLDIFWEVHDPTTVNQQGADEGTQYRSIILYANDEQKRLAEASKANAQKKFSRPLVTEIVPLKAFYPAEDYHQSYFKKHPDVPYCSYVIGPKLQKLEKQVSTARLKPKS
jgi:peptide-methionine (S)-S-oxide reductase